MMQYNGKHRKKLMLLGNILACMFILMMLKGLIFGVDKKDTEIAFESRTGFEKYIEENPELVLGKSGGEIVEKASVIIAEDGRIYRHMKAVRSDIKEHITIGDTKWISYKQEISSGYQTCVQSSFKGLKVGEELPTHYEYWLEATYRGPKKKEIDELQGEEFPMGLYYLKNKLRKAVDLSDGGFVKITKWNSK